MSVDDLYPGTTAQDDGDGSYEQTGTPDDAGRNADGEDGLRAEIERLRAVAAQALAEKGTLESLKTEIADLRARQQAPASAYGAQGVDPRVTQAQLQGRMAELEAEAARNPGSDAAIVVGLYGYARQMTNEVNALRDQMSVPVDLQEQVRTYQRDAQNRGEVISAATARKLIEADKLAGKSHELSTREADLQRQQDARDRGVVRTMTTPVPGGGAGPQIISMDEWSNRYDKLTPAQRDTFNARSSPTQDGRMRVNG